MPPTTRSAGGKRTANDEPSVATHEHKRARGENTSHAGNSHATRPEQSPEELGRGSQKVTLKVTSGGTSRLEIVESTGSLFDAPPNSVLVHACNTHGSWGGGIAKAFHQHYPRAFKVYARHCDSQSGLVGSALLIPPVDAASTAPRSVDDDDNLDTPKGRQKSNTLSETKSRVKPPPAKHFVGCLFTSAGYGKRRDSPASILRATGPAMRDLLAQIRDYAGARRAGDDGGVGVERGETPTIGEVWMCRINSGLFAVPWEDTKAELDKLDAGTFNVRTVRVVAPEK